MRVITEAGKILSINRNECRCIITAVHGVRSTAMRLQPGHSTVEIGRIKTNGMGGAAGFLHNNRAFDVPSGGE